MTGIYIHVPFCAKKCPYCDFYSCNYNVQKALAYKDAVIRNISNMPDISVDTVYFGGGTPSIIPVEYIDEILYAINKNTKLCSPEVTIEINPCTVTNDKLRLYKKAGVNRLSIGVQSADNDELKFLGRSHSFEKAEEVIMNAATEGFENISCDLMIGIKNQTVQKLEYSIDKLASMPIKHISSYILKVEENTAFGKSDIESLLPDEDKIADLYIQSVKSLEHAGFKQYEISNFSKDGFHSRHNLKYWKCEEYIGIGPSAHSFYNGKRYFVSNNLTAFSENKFQIITEQQYQAGTDEEKIMLALRLTDGINPDNFPEYRQRIIEKSKVYCTHGLAIYKQGRLRLTPKGFLLSNSIISDVIYE